MDVIKCHADTIYSYDGTLDNVSSDTTIEVYASEIKSETNFVVEMDGGHTLFMGLGLLNLKGHHP